MPQEYTVRGGTTVENDPSGYPAGVRYYDTVGQIAAAVKEAGDPRSIEAIQREIVLTNRLRTRNGVACTGQNIRDAVVHPGQELIVPRMPVAFEAHYDCPPERRRPVEPVEELTVQTPPAPRVTNSVIAPEFYPYQATTQFDNRNGYTNAIEMLASTGVEPFASAYQRGDIAARNASTGAPRSGMDGRYMLQGRQRSDNSTTNVDNAFPTLRETRRGRQGEFFFGGLDVGATPEETQRNQRLFLDGDFTGENEGNWVSTRVGGGIIGGTGTARGNLRIGQTSTTVDGATMPTYTVSTNDFTGRDNWFRNNNTQTSAPIGTYDRMLAYGDYTIAANEFRTGFTALKTRLEAGDPTITRADVQNVFNAGNYAQMNMLVRSTGMQNDLQSVMGEINTRFANYQWPATDTSPPLNLRNGVSPEIMNTPVAELATPARPTGYALTVMGAERRDQLADQYGAGWRFDGLAGIEGQPITGAYRVIHQRPSAVGQYIAENRANLVRGSQEESGQRSGVAVAAIVGTPDAVNAPGVTALWGVAAERSEVGTTLGQLYSRAYNNPELYGFANKRAVAEAIVRATGGDVNAADQITNRGGTSIVPLWQDDEGRLRDPLAFSRAVAANAGNPEVQADTVRLLTAAPTADRVAVLESLAADPRTVGNAINGMPQSLAAVAAAAGAPLDRTSPLFTGAVDSIVYSQPGFSEVTVSGRGWVDDWLATRRSWEANGRQGADPVLALTPAEAARLQASNELPADVAAAIGENRGNRTVNVVSGDVSRTRTAFASGDSAGAFNELVSGDQAQRSGSAQVVVEAIRFNPALAGNVIAATMRRDPQAFDGAITALRERDRETRGGGVPIFGRLFGLLDDDQFGQAADALQSSQRRVARLDESVWTAAAGGDARAQRQVNEAMKPWNDFNARIMSNPTSNGTHLRYAAFEEVWDAVSRDPRGQAAVTATLSAEPQFQAAAVDILRLTPMERDNMQETQFVGRGPGAANRNRAIPAPVTSPAIDAASNLFVSYGPTGRNGRIAATVNAGAFVAPEAPVAASAPTAPNSAAATVAAGGTIDSITTATTAADGTPQTTTTATGANPAVAGTVSTPAATAATAANPNAPVTAGSPNAPVTAGSLDGLSPQARADALAAATAANPNAPVTAGSPNAPVTAGNPNAPVTATNPNAPVTAGSPNAPVTAGSPNAPVTAGSPNAPVTAGSTVVAASSDVDASAAVVAGSSNTALGGQVAASTNITGVPGFFDTRMLIGLLTVTGGKTVIPDVIPGVPVTCVVAPRPEEECIPGGGGR